MKQQQFLAESLALPPILGKKRVIPSEARDLLFLFTTHKQIPRPAARGSE
jgi:hypothetical protein